MKKRQNFFFLLLPLLLFLFSIPACLVFNKVSYEIVLNDDRSGSAIVYITDITSDATDSEAFAQDTAGLFTQMLKSKEFIEEMKNEGRYITSRKLILNGKNLDAEIKYDFKNIVGIENIEYEDGFYYLTVGLADSVISTNGQVINSKTYKRILWDDKEKILKFEMFSMETDAYRKLGPYYKK
jgi:hypothetical protein